MKDGSAINNLGGRGGLFCFFAEATPMLCMICVMFLNHIKNVSSGPSILSKHTIIIS